MAVRICQMPGSLANTASYIWISLTTELPIIDIIPEVGIEVIYTDWHIPGGGLDFHQSLPRPRWGHWCDTISLPTITHGN